MLAWCAWPVDRCRTNRNDRHTAHRQLGRKSHCRASDTNKCRHIAASHPCPSAGAQVITTFTLVMNDGPKVGTWEVTYQGQVAGCTYLPNLDRWISTWLGPPPLTFVSARGDPNDANFLVTFDGESPTATRFLPLGEVTFELDDRGDTATLTLVSEENKVDFDDGSPSETIGAIELTIECGSIFRG